jgi:spore coat protein H
MTGINVIFDHSPRWALSEALSFEMYRMAGVAASATEHLRVWLDGRLLGYHLLIEQPNKAFLRRHVGDDSGNLYKLLWYGRGIVGQHEKKTNQTTGHGDLLETIAGLDRATGADQWAFIEKNFNVEQFINYYAVNMCIQNWDGFFNNYFTYHDTGGSGKWQIYPWDEDKTWGDFDGAPREYDWYTMPLTLGMRGDRRPKVDPTSRTNNRPGHWGGTSWWRPGGRFAEPMLANGEFRRRFLDRLEEMCNTLFTEETFLPVIDGLEKRLEPEVTVRAKASGQSAEQALRLFRNHIQSFRNQLKYRREFLLAELKKAKAARR